jgi:hypothetical protein
MCFDLGKISEIFYVLWRHPGVHTLYPMFVPMKIFRVHSRMASYDGVFSRQKRKISDEISPERHYWSNIYSVVSSIFFSFVQKVWKTFIVLPWQTWRATRTCVQCWHTRLRTLHVETMFGKYRRVVVPFLVKLISNIIEDLCDKIYLFLAFTTRPPCWWSNITPSRPPTWRPAV